MPEIVALSWITPKIVELTLLVVEIKDELPIAASTHDDEFCARLYVIARDQRRDCVGALLVRHDENDVGQAHGPGAFS
jgi:hypothetical protein